MSYDNDTFNLIFQREVSNTWLGFIRNVFLSFPDDLPEIILILSLIYSIGAYLNRLLKDFPVPLPVILFLLGSSFEILSFTSYEVQKYSDAIQWMNPDLFWSIFIPVIIFYAAFDMDVYMLQKLLWQILLTSVPGFLVNYILILWYLASVNKFQLQLVPRLLFSAILVSSDPMLTSAAIKDLGLSRSLINLINGESLMTSVMSLILYDSVMDIYSRRQSKMSQSIAQDVMYKIWTSFIASFFFGFLNSKLIQLWMSTVFGDDISHINLVFSVPYIVFYICKLVGISGEFTLVIMGLFLTSTSFKPGVEAFLLKFWNLLSFVAFLMVFTFIGLLIPTQTYLYVTFSDLYYSLNMYFMLIVLRLLVFLLMSPVLSRLGDGFSWRWAFIMVWSEMKGTPNINMALLLAYSELSVVSEREKSQILFHGVSICLITLIINKFILPMAVIKLGLHDVTSTKYKSLYYTFRHFQELIKARVSTFKLNKDLANSSWKMAEKVVTLRNPYASSQEDTTEHQKVTCPDCNKEIDETLNIEAMELANRRLFLAQIASYQRQYKCETLSQSATQVLVGAAGSFGEKKGEHLSPESIEDYSENRKLFTFIRKLLLNWVYSTNKDKGVPSSYFLLHVCHKLVFSEEFEYSGYLVILMNLFPITISWITRLSDIYNQELRYANYSFLTFYILEALLKIVAMNKDYFSHTWNVFELVITFIGIIDVIFIEATAISDHFDITQTVIFLKTVRVLRVLRLLKLVIPKLLQVVDRKMGHQTSFKYAIFKGYFQGEADIMTIIDKIASSKQIKQVLLKQISRNMEYAIKELSYLEYDNPEIAVTMKTKEETNVMLNTAREITKVFKSKGAIHKMESFEINKLIMARKREVLDFQSLMKPLTAEETLHHIPWLDKDRDRISTIQKRVKIIAYDCGNEIFEEGDEARGIYIIISGMVELESSKPVLGIDPLFSISEEKDHQIIYIDYVLSGEIIGELNCLLDEPMQYSAICKTVAEACFIPKDHLYYAFEQFYPVIEQKMWLKLGLAISANKIREHLSYEDWNYKMQMKLSNLYIKDIPLNTKTNIYNENVMYVILIHGAAEDCHLQRTYKAPCLIPKTCHQIQGTKDFTKAMIIKTAANMKKYRWNIRKYAPTRKISAAPGALDNTFEERLSEDVSMKEIDEPEDFMSYFSNDIV
ncbi:sodium/hydrogen exchanger 10 [Tupaia chinensis]|uniref:sodium/hydrogen exchanger 10 n=1 Tax=Tupaia chinensis TaxID=246437 RepID=UPI0003C9165F|nr:sodium/hydrogen exchanger 10 [Tupaia chinensis]XP_027630265.1 sodium/hydrogen exchanger 10 [Tupaia chinensis]XP_027630266.1 sodium/hydrogen exchanger 10 [Tupaia chinensis]